MKWINGQFSPIRTIIEQAKKTVSDRAAAWQKEEATRIRQEEEEARRKAEEEALKAAEEAAESGDEDRADRILDVASTTPAKAPPPPTRGSLTGATGGTRETWKGEVEFDNIREVCRAIADGHLPTNIIKDWHKTNLNGIAKEVGKSWPQEQDTGSHHGLTIARVTGLNVR